MENIILHTCKQTLNVRFLINNFDTYLSRQFLVLDGDSEITHPHRASGGSAGIDLYMPRDYTLPAQSQVYIRSGLAVKLPPGSVGLLKLRSGTRGTLELHGGVIGKSVKGYKYCRY